MPGELLALALGPELSNNPIGRAPNCFSRENRAEMVQFGVMSKLASPVPALRVISGTMKLSPGTTWVATRLGRRLEI